MAFYTSLDQHQLADLLARYGVPSPVACEGASDGIENSTYFLQSAEQRWILTLFEDLHAGELPFFIDLMQWLHAQGLPVAHPLTDQHGTTLHSLSDKPALLFPRLPGRHVTAVTQRECAAIGHCLGTLHRASQSYPVQRDNPRSTAWMTHAQDRLSGLIPPEDMALLINQTDNACRMRALDLPTGIIHGDLFRDNALFIEDKDGNTLSGVIDFYNACTDLLLLDLAIVVNDWCGIAGGGLDLALTEALVMAYIAERPLHHNERSHWQAVLQLAASRFWLSRLLAEKLPQRHGIHHAHKPSEEYRLHILYHQRVTTPLF